MDSGPPDVTANSRTYNAVPPPPSLSSNSSKTKVEFNDALAKARAIAAKLKMQGAKGQANESAPATASSDDHLTASKAQVPSEALYYGQSNLTSSWPQNAESTINYPGQKRSYDYVTSDQTSNKYYRGGSHDDHYKGERSAKRSAYDDNGAPFEDVHYGSAYADEPEATRGHYRRPDYENRNASPSSNGPADHGQPRGRHDREFAPPNFRRDRGSNHGGYQKHDMSGDAGYDGSNYASHDQSPSYSRPHSRPGLGSDKARKAEELVLSVPNEFVGLIIGRGGETIKGIEAKTSVRVQIEQAHGPPGTERKITLMGSNAEMIDYARKLIEDKVDTARRDRGMREHRVSGNVGYPPQRNDSYRASYGNKQSSTHARNHPSNFPQANYPSYSNTQLVQDFNSKGGGPESQSHDSFNGNNQNGVYNQYYGQYQNQQQIQSQSNPQQPGEYSQDPYWSYNAYYGQGYSLASYGNNAGDNANNGYGVSSENYAYPESGNGGYQGYYLPQDESAKNGGAYPTEGNYNYQYSGHHQPNPPGGNSS
ncbi:uncharacterized protein VTP21DRAFT_11507 [Calcarisporiella thermophila]|uniref:uncharacterized protein n=1 Tax=Calcarisporiella thermophila TaxID=911321 RepID=UPI003744A426